MRFIVEIYSKSGWCTRAWRTDTLKRALESIDDVGERAGPYFLIREIGAKGRVVRSLGVHTCPACDGRGVEVATTRTSVLPARGAR